MLSIKCKNKKINLLKCLKWFHLNTCTVFHLGTVLYLNEKPVHRWHYSKCVLGIRCISWNSLQTHTWPSWVGVNSRPVWLICQWTGRKDTGRLSSGQIWILLKLAHCILFPWPKKLILINFDNYRSERWNCGLFCIILIK